MTKTINKRVTNHSPISVNSDISPTSHYARRNVILQGILLWILGPGDVPKWTAQLYKKHWLPVHNGPRLFHQGFRDIDLFLPVLKYILWKKQQHYKISWAWISLKASNKLLICPPPRTHHSSIFEAPVNALHGHTFSRSGSEFRQLLDWLRVSFCEANTSIALKKPICWDIWVNHQKSPIPILSIHVFFRNSCKWEDIGWNLLGKRFQHVATGKFTACRLHPILDAKRPVLPGFSFKKTSQLMIRWYHQLPVGCQPPPIWKKKHSQTQSFEAFPKLPGWKLQNNWNCWSYFPVSPYFYDVIS